VLVHDFPVLSFAKPLRFDYVDVSGQRGFLWLAALRREVSGFVTVVARACLLAVTGLSPGTRGRRFPRG
jgi:hypothetical protein